MISIAIFLLPLIQVGLLSLTSESMCTNLVKLAQEKAWLDHPNMTIAVDSDVKNKKEQTRK